MHILHLDSSVLGAHSVSRDLTRETVAALVARNSSARITYRDLAASPLPHLSGEVLAATQTDAAQWSGTQQQEVAAGAAALGEFLTADVLVIGAPMYNFSVPSQLKAWIDRIVVAGKTFQYTEKGPVGLATGKRAIVVSTRGGIYSEGPAAALDHQESYLRGVLNFVGVTELTFVRAEGVAVTDLRAGALAAARARIATAVAAA